MPVDLLSSARDRDRYRNFMRDTPRPVGVTMNPWVLGTLSSSSASGGEWPSSQSVPGGSAPLGAEYWRVAVWVMSLSLWSFEAVV